MSPPFGIGLEVWIGLASLAFLLFGCIAAFFYWKGGLDKWISGIDEWRKSVDNRFDKLVENINALMSDVAVIKAASEKDATRNGMIQRQSPLVPAKKAIEILEELNIISQVDANISYIRDEIEKRSQTLIYRDIEDREERFIEIAPGVIHALIKKGKIEEKKMDDAMKKLEDFFPVVTYYGVLLLIAAYILEKRREKGFRAKPSMVYSQIEMAGLKDRDELLASVDGDAEKAIKSLKRGIKTLEEIGNKKELAENKFMLALMYGYIGRTEEAEEEYKETLRLTPDCADAHNNLGVLLHESERLEEAEKEYKEALRINPKLAEAHNNLGILFGDLKRFEEAEKEYKEAISLKNDLPDKGAMAHYNLGILLGDLKRFEEAEEEYNEALNITPNFAEAHGNLGNLYSQTGRVEEAKEELETAKRLFEQQGRAEDVKKAEELLKAL